MMVSKSPSVKEGTGVDALCGAAGSCDAALREDALGVAVGNAVGKAAGAAAIGATVGSTFGASPLASTSPRGSVSDR